MGESEMVEVGGWQPRLVWLRVIRLVGPA